MPLSFPPSFLWGTATAAQQVEGQNLNSDWTRWEQLPGKIKHGDSSAVACDWWGGRWREDFDRAQALGMNAQRISIEWARAEPARGKWDKSALAHYRELIRGLRERGMEPFVTLHHFTSPQWVAERGGFENPEVAHWAAQWANTAASELGDLVQYWFTLNEPNVYAYQCYLAGLWLAQKKEITAYFRVTANLVRAHAAMYHAIKRVRADAQVGFAQHWRAFEPYHPNSPLDRLAAGLRARLLNELFVSAVQEGRLVFPLGLNQSLPEAQGTMDFLGVNYYYQEYTAFDALNAAQVFGRSVYDANVERLKQFYEETGNLHADAFGRLLERLGQERLPMLISENGLYETDRDDQTRYLVSHLQAVHTAIQKGADVRGYFWWSLLDNFEWSEGYTPRFGLYRLDRATQARTLKPVGEVYGEVVRGNAIPDRLLEKYGRT